MNVNAESVKLRLEQFGYVMKTTDAYALDWAIQKAAAYICNECNVTDVPDSLAHAAVDMAVGEFLQMKKTFAPDDLVGFDLTGAVKQLQEGDTNVTFSTGEGTLTDEQRLSSFIDSLLNCGKTQFSCFRRLRW